MTSPGTQSPQTQQEVLPPAPLPVIVPEPDSRLDQLMAQLEGVKKAKADAAKAEKALTDSIKAEAYRLVPEGTTELIIRSPWTALPWKASPREEWRIDSTRLKEERLETWVEYAKKIVSWRLDPMK